MSGVHWADEAENLLTDGGQVSEVSDVVWAVELEDDIFAGKGGVEESGIVVVEGVVGAVERVGDGFAGGEGGEMVRVRHGWTSCDTMA